MTPGFVIEGLGMEWVLGFIFLVVKLSIVLIVLLTLAAYLVLVDASC